MPRGIYPRKNPSPYMKKKLAEEVKKTKKSEETKPKTAKRRRVVKKAAKTTKRIAPREALKRRRVRRRSIAEKAAAKVMNHVHTSIAHDAKINPAHYVGKSGQQVIDVLEDFDMVGNMYRGQAIQYMFRAGRKNKENVITDLLKAKWFIDREIAHLTKTKEIGS